MGWWFAPQGDRLAHGDGRRVRVGVTHTVTIPTTYPIPCRSGLHASLQLLNALDYAHSAILYRVRLSGVITKGYDKACATRRKYLARINVSRLLQYFVKMLKADAKAHAHAYADYCVRIQGSSHVHAYAAYYAHAYVYADPAYASARSIYMNKLLSKLVQEQLKKAASRKRQRKLP